MEPRGPDSEWSVTLAMARRLRLAAARREHSVRPIRDRYDRCERDPRVMPEKRAQVAAAFVQAAYRAEHAYEDCLDRGLRASPDADRQ